MKAQYRSQQRRQALRHRVRSGWRRTLGDATYLAVLAAALTGSLAYGQAQAGAQQPAWRCELPDGNHATLGWGHAGPPVGWPPDHCHVAGIDPGPNTWETSSQHSPEVGGYLQALHEVDVYFRAVQVERWEQTGLIGCESGGDWQINTGRRYYGGAQMGLPFWRQHGGPQFASRPDLAEPWQQATVLDRFVDRGGSFRQAFPGCARRLGLS